MKTRVLVFTMSAFVMVLIALAGCSSPVGVDNSSIGSSQPVGANPESGQNQPDSTNPESESEQDGQGETDSGVTIMFDSEFGGLLAPLQKTGSAPAAVSTNSSGRIRLPEGNGLQFTDPNGVTYYAAGWSTMNTEDQGTNTGLNLLLPSPEVFIPGYEYTFTENTTLYPRWTRDPVQIVYMLNDFATGDPIDPITSGPIYAELDEIVMETWSEFSARMNPPYTVPSQFDIFEWRATSVTSYPSVDGRKPGRSATVGHFDPTATTGDFRAVYITHEIMRQQEISFDYATPGVPNETRKAFWNGVLNPASGPDPNSPWYFEWPADPERTGLDFAGWFDVYELNDEYWPQTSIIRRADYDIDLIARWRATVTFNSNGGTAIAPVILDEGEVLSAPADPVPPISGDIFDGWFTDPGLTSPYDFSHPVAGHLTLYAGYSAPFAVGDTGPAGGTIFYVAQDASAGWRYLEAAPADLAGTYQWGLWGTEGTLNNRDFEWFTSSSHNSFGGGLASTQAIIDRIIASIDSQKSSYASTTAAHAADTYSIENSGVTYDDWYLPSVNELLEIQSLWVSLGMVNDQSSVTNRYWTSTSYPAPGYSIGQMESRAFTVGRNPENGTLTLDFPAAVTQRIAERRVRPIRRF